MLIGRPALRFVGGIVLALSLVLKLPGIIGLAAGAPGVSPEEIAALLQRNGYQVSYDVDSSDKSLTWISGRMMACDVLIATVGLQGWHRSLIAQRAMGNQLFYTFDGEIHPEQPIMKTRIHHYWTKLNRYLGLDAQAHPLLAVIAAPTCRNMPLGELALLPGEMINASANN